MVTSRIAQVPVIIAPIGKMRMFSPGMTKGMPLATTSVCMGASTSDTVGVTGVEKMPETKVASCEERLVFTNFPVLSVPVRLTVGTRTSWRPALCCVNKEIYRGNISQLTFPCSPSARPH